MDRGHDPGIQGFSYRAKDAPFPSCTNFLQPVRCDQAEMQGSQPVPTSSPPKGATKLKYRVPGERKTTQQARLMSWVHVPTEQAREHCVRVPSPPLGVHCPLSWYSARRSRPLPGSKAGQRASLGSSGTKGRHYTDAVPPSAHAGSGAVPPLELVCRGAGGMVQFAGRYSHPAQSNTESYSEPDGGLSDMHTAS